MAQDERLLAEDPWGVPAPLGEGMLAPEISDLRAQTAAQGARAHLAVLSLNNVTRNCNPTQTTGTFTEDKLSSPEVALKTQVAGQGEAPTCLHEVAGLQANNPDASRDHLNSLPAINNLDPIAQHPITKRSWQSSKTMGPRARLLTMMATSGKPKQPTQVGTEQRNKT